MVGAAVLAFAGNWFWQQRGVRSSVLSAAVIAGVERDKRITELERQLALVSQAVMPISAAIQAILIKELTHFHTPLMDALMVKLGPPNTLTIAEEAELQNLYGELVAKAMAPAQ